MENIEERNVSKRKISELTTHKFAKITLETKDMKSDKHKKMNI